MDSSSLHSVPSTSTATATTFASLESGQVQLLQTIIDRVPPQATTFLSIYAVYQKVLQQHNLNPENDVVYYGVLLKLAMEMGETWKQKWEGVKVRYFNKGSVGNVAVALPSPPPSIEEEKLKAGGLKSRAAKTTLNLKSLPNAPASTTPRRPRQFLVPPPPNQPVESTDAESDLPHPITPFALFPKKQLRLTEDVGSSSATTGPSLPPLPSYRSHSRDARIQVLPARLLTRKSRSVISEGTKERETAVGPLQSTPAPGKRWGKPAGEDLNTHVEFGSFALDTVPRKRRKSLPPDLRESVRTQEQEQRNRRLEEEEKEEEERRERVLADRKRREDARKEKEEEREREQREEKRIKMLESQADKFRTLSLLGTRWDRWRFRAEQSRFNREREELVTLTLRSLALRRSIHNWSRRLYTIRGLQPVAEEHRAIHLLHHFFNLWRKRRRDAKEARLRAAWTQVRSRWKKRWARKVWDTWMWRTKEREAERHDEKRITSAVFARWRRRTKDVKQMDVKAASLELAFEERTKRKVWKEWKWKGRVIVAEKRVTQKHTSVVLLNAWTLWKQRTNENVKALDFRIVLLQRSALNRWKQQLWKTDMLRQRLFQLEQEKDSTTLWTVFARWRAVARRKHLERQRNSRLLQTAFSCWKRKRDVISALEEREYQFRHDLNNRLKRSVLALWSDRLATHQNALSVAVTFHSRSIIIQTLNKWSTARQRQRKMAWKAEKARNLFLKATIWNNWRFAVITAKQERWLQARNEKTMRGFFGKWRERTDRLVALEDDVEDFQIKVNQRLATSVIRNWFDKVIDVREKSLIVDRARRRKLLTLAFNKWTDDCYRHGDLIHQAEEFFETRERDRAHKMFVLWSIKTSEIRERKRKMQERKAAKRLKLLTTTFIKWNDKLKERNLANQELMLREAYEERLARQTLAMWETRSTAVAAIRFHNEHLKIRILHSWRRAVPIKQNERLADETLRKSLQLKALQTWQARYGGRMAVRAANRFRVKAPVGRRSSTTSRGREASPQILYNRPGDREPTPSTSEQILRRRPASDDRPYGLANEFARATASAQTRRERTASPTRSPIKTTSRPSSRLTGTGSRMSNYERQREEEEEEWQDQVRRQMRGAGVAENLSRNTPLSRPPTLKSPKFPTMPFGLAGRRRILEDDTTD
ncbi:hypothetical protein BT69DRAFT_1348874 [Atractiella rhizophila]|nr:hypothetical protein BT69DRAFT_1348874 [Atractiella rhizophila]